MSVIEAKADRCPYPRPFPEDFTECPAYQATVFIAVDSRNKPLGTWHTCRHLAPGSDIENRGRFYPRCALGDLAQRMQWVAHVTPERLDVVRALQEEFDHFSLPHREMLVDARARLHQQGADSEATDSELQQLIDAFLDAIDRFLKQNEARFRDVGLPPEPLKRLIKEWLWAWMRSGELATSRLSQSPGDALEDSVGAFLGVTADSPQYPARRLWDRPLYTDSLLRIVPTVEPPGLALVGDVDGTNIEAVTQALWSVRNGTDDVHLDLSGLLFCDLRGLQAIVRTSQALDGGRSLVLHGLPRQLERALEIVEWAPLPHLKIAREVAAA